MKKVVVLGDVLMQAQTKGIQRFAREVLRELDVIPRPYEIEILVPEQAEIASERFSSIKIVRYGRLRNAFLWRQLCFPLYAMSHHAVSVDLTLGLPYAGCDVVCLHDCIYENMPSAFSSPKEKIRRRSYLLRAARLVKKAKKLLAVSQNTKSELVACYGIPPEKIAVVHNAWQHFNRVDENEAVFHKLGLDLRETYFFALGSGLRHKNFDWIARAAAQNPAYRFIVTGDSRMSRYAQEIGRAKPENLTFTGYLSDGEVKALMRRARAFLHPSFYEGFGIPPLEALSVGAEIIISNASCLPEIYGDSARYIDPRAEQINMDEILKQSFNRESGILEKYSWRKSAEALDSILREMALAGGEK